MKRNRLVAFATAFSLMASLCTGFISASAADNSVPSVEVQEVTKGVELVYDEASSTSTEKVINAYYRGLDDISSAKLNLAFPGDTVTAATFKTDFPASPVLTDEYVAEGKFNIFFSMADGTTTENNLLGTITLTVAEGTETFTVSVSDVEIFNDALDSITMSDADASSVEIPGYEDPNKTPEPVEKGVELVYDEENSTATEKVINAYYRGLDDISSAKLNLTFPESTVTAATFKTNFPATPVLTDEYVAEGKFNIFFSMADGTTTENNLLGTITLTVAEGTPAFKVTVADVEIFNDALDSITKDDADESWVLIPAFGSATEAPEVTTAPTVEPTTAPTEAPTEAVRPTPLPTEPVVTEEPSGPEEPVEKGVELVYDEENSTATEKVINAYYRGLDDISSAKLNLTFPESTVTAATFKTNFPATPVLTDEYVAEGKFNIFFSMADGTTTENNLLGTITLTVAEGTPAFKVTVADVEIFNDALDSITKDDADESWVLIPAFATATEEPEETPAPTDMPIDDSVKVSDLITNAPETDDTYGKLTGIVVEVKKADGTDAKYGEDYVAIYDGKQLTEDEFFNMINGYSQTPIADVIKGLSIGAKYETGVTVKASPAYQTDEQAASGNWTVVPGYGNTADIKEETPSTKATLTLTKPTNGTIYAEYVDADNNTVKITDYGKAVEIPTGTKVTYTAVADTGYTFKSWSGITSSSAIAKDIVFSKTITVAATFGKVSSGGSTSGGSTSGGSTSSGSGSGTIAGGTGGVTPGTTPNSGVNFQDLGSVQWAVPAINTLVNLGVINGRSDTIFDPNASVTRAEFTKMVCAAFGIASTPEAAQTFTDVAPTDWFYGYVQAAAAKGIVNGVSDTAFDPNATIKRQEMAAILYRTIQATNALALLPQGTEKAFADAAQIDEYAQIPVSVLSSAGVINGVTDTTFEPYATATRAQAACIIYQYYQAIGAA